MMAKRPGKKMKGLILGEWDLVETPLLRLSGHLESMAPWPTSMIRLALFTLELCCAITVRQTKQKKKERVEEEKRDKTWKTHYQTTKGHAIRVVLIALPRTRRA